MENLYKLKKRTRLFLKEKRDFISSERKITGALALLKAFSAPPFKDASILSFVSFKTEINTLFLNIFLAQHKRLLLPKIEGDDLLIYQIDNLKDLRMNHFGIFEPGPHLYPITDMTMIKAILVPGLGFDKNKHRLGYGKGYYDRFLKRFSAIPTFGVGFKEQFVNHLPVSSEDVALQHIYLF